MILPSKAAGLSIYCQGAAYRLVILEQQVEFAQLYLHVYHQQSNEWQASLKTACISSGIAKAFPVLKITHARMHVTLLPCTQNFATYMHACM